MPIRTILAAGSGGSATEGAFELACNLASRLDAHVEGFHVMIDPLQVFAAFGAGDGIAVSGALIDEMTADAEKGTAKMETAFKAAAGRHTLAYRSGPGGGAGKSSCTWRQETGYPPTLVAQRARFFDLVVLGRSERAIRRPHSDTIEETLTQSGRPVLLAPSHAPTTVGGSVAVAWNGSPEAVRALAVSLPVLSAADVVTLITAGADDASDVAGLTDHLAWHGIAADRHHVAFRSGD
ncbi:MAG: hypothetical protein JO258_01975, partial [Alphaproteobacteria bacterium]|nr:hypothetical protein [Alphaproteobacteria bacterium]